MWALLLTGEWHMAGVALAVLMIVIFDATSLRREIGRHAIAINQLSGSRLRETMGHGSLDIAGGVVLGFVVAIAYWLTGTIP
jgi:acid phosphatase family membrane protein YuiD